ncbi:MAG: response regulator [Desulfobacterales bacterium]|jgi:DNA-binding NtrC family response regulator|nr:response regulator [Desulfobacteraceae bacterium]MDD3991966.1 response regulator [Desulfobacteraceae bacterium]MDY0311963.1 response regulator [Desulfobacterales bacterium]
MRQPTILVVDDEIDFLETIVNRLRKRGMAAEGVDNGREAIRRIVETPFDVVLLDIKMPGGMDGIEVLRQIKEQRPETEVILLTGHASVETSLEGMELGAFDYLLKPMRFEELLKKIAVALEK